MDMVSVRPEHIYITYSAFKKTLSAYIMLLQKEAGSFLCESLFSSFPIEFRNKILDAQADSILMKAG